MNIIIVDDDSLVAGALKTILEINPDINITATGSDGQEACELYRRIPAGYSAYGYPHEKYVWTGGICFDPERISRCQDSASDHLF